MGISYLSSRAAKRERIIDGRERAGKGDESAEGDALRAAAKNPRGNFPPPRRSFRVCTMTCTHGMQSLCMMAYIQIALYRRMRERARARARIDVTDKCAAVAVIVSSLLPRSLVEAGCSLRKN